MAGKIRFENTETAQLYGNEVYVYKHKGYAAGICHGVKDGDENCKNEMADFLSKQIAWDCVLIPVPQHTGKAEYTLDIANKIKERIGNIYNIQISDILESDERPTLYEQKQKIIEKTSSSFTEEEISNLNTGNIRIKQGCEIPKQNQNVYILDNVISTGKTYEEIEKLIPGSYPLIFAASKKYIEKINLRMDNISDYINNHYEEDKQIKQFSDSLTTSERLKLKQLWIYEDDNFTVNRNTLSVDDRKINIGNYLKLILRNNIDRIENPLDYDNKDVLNDHCKYIQSLRNKWAQTVDYPLKKEDEIKASQYYFESNYIYSQDKNLWERIEDEATIKYPNDFESVNKLLNDYKEKYNNCKKIEKDTLSNYVDKENGPYELLKYLRVEKELNSDDIKSQIISTYINTSDNEINEKKLLKNTLNFFENENDYSEIIDNFDFMLIDKKDKEMELENWKKEQELTKEKPYSFFVKDNAEFEFFADFEPITNLSSEEALNTMFELEERGFSAGIGIYIKNDFIFNDPDGEGNIIFNKINDEYSFYMGDNFVKELKYNDEHSKNVIEAFKELDHSVKINHSDIPYKEPSFIYEKEKELNESQIDSQEENTMKQNLRTLNNNWGMPFIAPDYWNDDDISKWNEMTVKDGLKDLEIVSMLDFVTEATKVINGEKPLEYINNLDYMKLPEKIESIEELVNQEKQHRNSAYELFQNITQVEINNKTFKDSCNNMIMNNPVNSIKEIECSITENLSDKEIESVVKQTNDFIKNKAEENISTKNNQNNNGSRKGGRK